MFEVCSTKQMQNDDITSRGSLLGLGDETESRETVANIEGLRTLARKHRDYHNFYDQNY